MSTLSDVEAKLGIIETDVVKFFSTTLPAFEQKIVTDVQAVAQVFDNVLQWIGAHGQEIATDVAGLVGVVAAAGIGIPAPVLAASTALNTAVSLVDTAIAAQQAAAAGSAAYQSLKTAQIATSTAQATVAAPPAVAPIAT
jgi:phage-related protein